MVKRLFDILVVIVTAPIWIPVLGVIGFLVRWNLGSPIFFRQKRPGYHGTIFELIKFRTMTDEKDAAGNLLPDQQRLSRFGQWLRASSLDELPELICVLRGEMSLVGPRPLLIEYLPRYDVRQARRHDVLPGLTGLAQVRGRNELSWEEKFEWDVQYVERRNFWLDLKILARTFELVLVRRGISARGQATMPEFNPTRRSHS
jgi:sugar transferase EpsL